MLDAAPAPDMARAEAEELTLGSLGQLRYHEKSGGSFQAAQSKPKWLWLRSQLQSLLHADATLFLQGLGANAFAPPLGQDGR